VESFRPAEPEREAFTIVELGRVDLNSSPLALRTEIGAPSAEGDALNRGVTNVAPFTTAVGNLEKEMGKTQLTIRVLIGIDTGTTVSNSSY